MERHGRFRSAEFVSRRMFLRGAAGTLGGLSFSGMMHANAAQQLASRQKHCIVFWLSGGVSQFESWDPKPGTETGGPFRTIATSVPGVHISELLPHTARQLHHLAIVRGINTKEDEHGRATYMMETGRPQAPGFEYPYIGPSFSSLLSPPDNPLPSYIYIGASRIAREASFLDPRFAPVALSDVKPPPNLELAEGRTAESDRRRREFRARLGQRFVQGRVRVETEAYNASHDQAAALMARREIFDFSAIPDSDHERYGRYELGRHVLMARKLIESGITFVKVKHNNYDTHAENFNFHLEQLGEFDRPFAALVADLADRGLLSRTLIIVTGEFGRTPKINNLVGRDHWATGWSLVLGGAKIKGGAVVGAMNANGTQITGREINHGHLFHTYYKALGLDSTEPFTHEGRPFDKADPNTEAITELLA